MRVLVKVGAVVSLWLAVLGVGRAETVTVLAAASLRESFLQAAREFEASHPGVHVRVSFAGSQSLAASILSGAPADVFASADRTQMLRVVNGGEANPTDVHPLVRNELVIVVSQKSTASIRGVPDLAKPGVRLFIAKPTVPAGEYARSALAKGEGLFGKRRLAAIWQNVRSGDGDVRAVLTHVVLGEADAGIVYRTDAIAAEAAVRMITLPEPMQVRASYSIAVLKNHRAASAKDFSLFLISKRGQAILSGHGFIPR